MRALLVEDNVYVAESNIMLLKIYGIIVDWAATGQKGLEFAEKNRYDFAIIDVGLPDMSGIEVAKLIKSMKKGMVLVAYTATDCEEETKDVFDLFFRKPFRMEKILEAIRNSIQLRTNRQKALQELPGT